MKEAQYITISEAATKAGVWGSTIRIWCERYGIGRKVVGRWRVDPAKLEALINPQNSTRGDAA